LATKTSREISEDDGLAHKMWLMIIHKLQ